MNKYLKTTIFSISLSIVISFCNFIIIKEKFKSEEWIIDNFLIELTRQPVTLYFLLGIIIYILGYNIFIKFLDRKIKYFFVIYAILFSFFNCIGKSYMYLSTWEMLFSSKINILFSIFIIICHSLIIYYFLKLIYFLLIKYNFLESNYEMKKNIYYFIIGIFFTINIFFLIIFYPGNASFDGQLQLNQFFGFQPLTNHHPVISTILEGLIFYFGMKLVNMNFGIFLCVFIQIVFQSVIFAYAVKVIADVTKNKILIIYVLVFFMLNPIFPLWGICLVKDTIYYNSFLWMFLILIKFYTNNFDKNKYLLLQFIVSTLLVCIFRNNGIYIVLPVLFYLFFMIRNNMYYKKFIIIYIIFLVMGGWFQNFALNYYNIPKASITNFLVLPFQQTARLIWANKEIDEKDKIKLNEIFKEKDLKEIYNPELADPVRGAFYENRENVDEWENFYFKYLKIYPSVYLQAILNHDYGYVYLFKEPQEFFIDNIRRHELLNVDYFTYDTNKKFVDLRNILLELPQIYKSIPILNLTYSCGFYVWVIVLCGTSLILKKKYKYLLLVMPLILSIGVCLLSPVNADFRYLLPVVVTFPIFSAYYLSIINKDHKNTF